MASNHLGVPITPATLKDGSLFSSLDPVALPSTSGHEATVNTGTPKTGALGVPVLSAPVHAAGGTLAAGARAYKVSAIGVGGEGSRCAAQSVTVLLNEQVTLTWTSPAGETGGFRVYVNGLHLADVAHGTLTYVDNGSVTPSGAEPTNAPGNAGMAQGDSSPVPKDGGQQDDEAENPNTLAGQTQAGRGLSG